jgi:sensor histidine kinase YesM
LRSKLTTFIHLAVWSVAFAFPFFVTPPTTPPPFIQEQQIPFRLFVIFFIFLIAVMFYFNMNLLIPKVLYRRNWLFFLASIFGCYFLLLALVFVIVKMQFPPHNLPTQPPVVFFSFLFFFSTAIGTSIRLSVDKVKFDNQLREKDNENLKSELSLLRSQVSPHFMFNVLNSLSALARKKSDQMEPVIIQLSKLMRYMLYDSEDEKITVERELEYLNSYISLQKLRFGNDVEVEFKTRLEKKGVPIEPMLLIPFVENAFKHGIGMIVQPKIEIEFATNSSHISFTVRNKMSLINSNDKDSSSGIGLVNLTRRLRLLYKDRHEIKTYITKDSWHIAHLEIAWS